MQTLRLYSIWLGRAWPVLGVMLIIILHLVLVNLPHIDIKLVNKYLSFCLQSLGGLLVLKSIDGNLGLFLNKKIGSIIIAWFREFPRCRPPINAHANIAAGSGTTASIGAVVVRNVGIDINSRVAELERKFSELQKEIADNGKATNQRIDDVIKNLNHSSASTSNTITQLADKVVEAAIGSLKQQVFGVLIAIYGTMISTFWI